MKTNCKQQHEAKITVKQQGRNKDIAKGKNEAQKKKRINERK